MDLGEEVKKKREKEVPPYTGFGSEADSKTSCGGLEPRAPQRDFFKFMNKDRDGFDSHILRFSARLVSDGKVETQRKFVVSYFLSDDSILVNLIPEQNSGMYIVNRNFMKIIFLIEKISDIFPIMFTIQIQSPELESNQRPTL